MFVLIDPVELFNLVTPTYTAFTLDEDDKE